MKTIIKIHNRQWFKGNCRVTSVTGYGNDLEPKHSPWRHVLTLPWSLKSGMGQLVGHVLEVEKDDGVVSGNIDNARYFAGGYWIPNWAIEWVMEVEND